MGEPSFASVKAKYRKRWDAAAPNADKVADADRFVKLILKNRMRYEAVSAETGVPFYFIAVTHMRESSCDFAGVLHNGEHIIGTGRKTRLVPAGRGPFDSWEESAIDALRLHNLHKVANWSIERVLYECERFNGWGYFNRGRPSPYVWAGTKIYVSGKYVRDGVYDPDHIDTQLGCAVVLKRLEAAGLFVDGQESAPAKQAPEPAKIPPPPDIPTVAPREAASKTVGTSKTIWAVLAGIIAQLGAALTDWKVAAVICAFITIILLVFIGRERIRKIIDQGL